MSSSGLARHAGLPTTKTLPEVLVGNQILQTCYALLFCRFRSALDALSVPAALQQVRQRLHNSDGSIRRMVV